MIDYHIWQRRREQFDEHSAPDTGSDYGMPTPPHSASQIGRLERRYRQKAGQHDHLVPPLRHDVTRLGPHLACPTDYFQHNVLSIRAADPEHVELRQRRSAAYSTLPHFDQSTLGATIEHSVTKSTPGSVVPTIPMLSRHFSTSISNSPGVTIKSPARCGGV